MAEVRVFAEGALRWVNASGTGTSWQTASAATTGLYSYVEVGFSITSAQNVVTVKDRGIPTHHKIVGREPIPVKFSIKETDIAQLPAYTATADGASIPLLHFELKSDADEGDATAVWRQFIRCAFVDETFTEGEEGNIRQQNWVALAMNGPTGSGYIA